MPGAIRRLRTAIQRSETAGPVALATTVGLLAGTGAILLRVLIRGVQWLFFDQGDRLGPLLARGATVGSGLLERLPLILAPAAGMVLVSWIVRTWAPEARGHGVPEVQYAIRMKGGRIRPRVAAVKAIASALSIGSGGSVGREGPIVQIGSALGSTIGQMMGVGADGVRVLVAAGAAGAIGATFNAPIAGVVFALEVILGSFAARSFGLVVIAAVTATALSQAVLGREPAFQLVETFELVNNREFLFYLVLGLITGVVALVYVQSVYWFEDSFERWSAPATLKAALGGVAVGLLGAYGSEHLFGVGHEGVELALRGELAAGLMLWLVLLKILATSITLGAGGSGGVFAPALFVGAMLGGAFGRFANALFPGHTAAAGAYALVGMGALFGAAAHAPITGIVILFEMTDNYQIILPLMLSVVLSHLVAARLYPDSIYSIKLRRRGALRPRAREVGILDVVIVDDAMSTDYQAVRPDDDVSDLMGRTGPGAQRSWPVVDDEGSLLGIVTESDLEAVLLDEGSRRERVRDVMTTAVLTCTPHESLRSAFRLLAQADVQQIPVVDEDYERTLLGVLRRSELIWAVRELSREHEELLAQVGSGAPLVPSDAVQMELAVEEWQQAIAYRRIQELELPRGVLVVLLRRSGRSWVPSGASKVEPGDVLVLLTTRRNEHRLGRWIAQQSSRSAHGV